MKSDEAFQDAFYIYRDNPAKLLAATLIYWFLQGFSALLFILPLVGFFVVALVNPLINKNPNFILSPISLFFLALAFAGLILCVAIWGILQGGMASFFAAIRNGSSPEYSMVLNPKNKASLALAPFIQAIPPLVVIGIAVLTSLPFFMNVSGIESWASLLTAFAIIFMGVLFALVLVFFLWFTVYAIALDNRGPLDAAKTSIRFVRNNMLEVIVFSVLLFAISLGVGIVSTMIALPFMLIPFLGEIFSTLIQLALSLLVAPWITMSFVVFYLNLTSKTPSPRQMRATPRM